MKYHLIFTSIFLLSCQTQQSFTLAPRYDPIIWSEQSKVENNNCYSYAINRDEGKPYDPGYLSGYGNIKKITLNAVIARSKEDGLVAVSSPNECRGNAWAAALVMNDEHSDYHWYRQDDDGFWSHKFGSTAISNTDNSGNLIRDPSKAARGKYSDFIGYFCVVKRQYNK